MCDQKVKCIYQNPKKKHDQKPTKFISCKFNLTFWTQKKNMSKKNSLSTKKKTWQKIIVNSKKLLFCHVMYHCTVWHYAYAVYFAGVIWPNLMQIPFDWVICNELVFLKKKKEIDMLWTSNKFNEMWHVIICF